MGIVVPLWIWLPIILWVMWRWERKQRIRQALTNQWGQIRYTQHERGLDMLGREIEPHLLLENEMMEKKARPRMGAGIFEMRNVIIVGVLGIISAFVYAWEPGPPVATAENPAVITPQIAGQPAQAVYPPGGPPGMVFDPEHNSWHFPAAVPPTSPHR